MRNMHVYQKIVIQKNNNKFYKLNIFSSKENKTVEN